MNHMKFCSCKACKAGRHCANCKARTKRATRGARHAAKTDLAKGKTPNKTISVPYTD